METIVALALLFALAMATYLASRSITGFAARLRRERPVAARSFPAVMSRETQWARVTGIVEMSLARAADMVSHNAAAARQLEAAEYGLHCLLGELGQVMATAASSPLAEKVWPAAAPAQLPSAMAA